MHYMHALETVSSKKKDECMYIDTRSCDSETAACQRYDCIYPKHGPLDSSRSVVPNWRLHERKQHRSASHAASSAGRSSRVRAFTRYIMPERSAWQMVLGRDLDGEQ